MIEKFGGPPESAEEPPFKKGDRVTVRRELMEKLAEGRRMVLESGIGKELGRDMALQPSEHPKLGEVYRVLFVDTAESQVYVGPGDLTDEDVGMFPDEDIEEWVDSNEELVADKYRDIGIFNYGELVRVME